VSAGLPGSSIPGAAEAAGPSASARTENGRGPRVIAFYLPQFHPIPENDEWWGRGFTEWTNVARARPLFRGHYQPHVPADLGFYDLRLPETREAQAEMARAHGVEGFCYWHYWFGDGRRILERPFDEVLASGRPDFPFCLGWANQTWSGIWHGAPDRVLIRQTYPGPADHERHFRHLLPAFRDRRYLRVDGRPIFVVYAPAELPEAQGFLDQWNELARAEGFPGIYFVAHWSTAPAAGFDVFVRNLPFLYLRPTGPRVFLHYLEAALRRIFRLDLQRLGLRRGPTVRRYIDYVRHLERSPLEPRERPLLIPNWDNTPRSGRRGVVLHGSTPELFARACAAARSNVMALPNPDERLVFVKAWNEWAEGNHLEPDQRFGLEYLHALDQFRRP
jgi:hypothetical protein